MREPDWRGSVEPFLIREKRMLELLLDDSGLNLLRGRIPSHPAVSRYDTITRFIASEQKLRHPGEVELMLEIGSTLVGALAIDPAITPESVLEKIDDPEVLRQLRARVLDQDQFADQMAALACWGMLCANGTPAKLVEKEGLPDIVVPITGDTTEWIEVKRIRIGTEAGRARKVIQKANEQIKRTDSGAVGAVYISIERPQQRPAFDEVPSPEVQPYIAEVERELGSGFSRSVASVIVAWDDFIVLGTPPERTNYFFRRHSVTYQHRSPHRSSQLSKNALELRRTVWLPIIWSSPTPKVQALAPIHAGRVTITESFRSECEAPGYVRAAHAIEMAEQPEDMARYELGGINVVLMTKSVVSASPAYKLLLIALDRGSDQIEIYLGFRIYQDVLDLAKGTQPFELFVALLERYGLPVQVGSHHGLFIPRSIIEVPPGGAAQLVRPYPTQDEKVYVNMFVTIRDTSPRTADVAWAFAILGGRYGRDIQKRRR